MFQRRRNDVETVLVDLPEQERADEIHVCDRPEAVADIAECQNPRAPSALAEPVPGEERLDLNSGALIRNRTEIDGPGRSALAEVFARERRVGAAVDGPVKRFTQTPALGR